uniref:Uncharacterized protein LOC105038266 n=1 Tax=Elaeis guineensis var. tenera TaxID=51953 RepID=A0A6I9QRR9_ELAGV|nr:uncharacterized protein LOC105038266 [Elaeis guineensis]
MPESLASLLHKKEHKSEEIKPKGCFKGSGRSSGEDVGRAQGVLKKVSFSLEEDKPELDEVQRKIDGKYFPKKRRFSPRRSTIAFRLAKAIEEDGVVEVPARNTVSIACSYNNVVPWCGKEEREKAYGSCLPEY